MADLFTTNSTANYLSRSLLKDKCEAIQNEIQFRSSNEERNKIDQFIRSYHQRYLDELYQFLLERMMMAKSSDWRINIPRSIFDELAEDTQMNLMRSALIDDDYAMIRLEDVTTISSLLKDACNDPDFLDQVSLNFGADIHNWMMKKPAHAKVLMSVPALSRFLPEKNAALKEQMVYDKKSIVGKLFVLGMVLFVLSCIAACVVTAGGFLPVVAAVAVAVAFDVAIIGSLIGLFMRKPKAEDYAKHPITTLAEQAQEADEENVPLLTAAHLIRNNQNGRYRFDVDNTQHYQITDKVPSPIKIDVPDLTINTTQNDGQDDVSEVLFHTDDSVQRLSFS